MSGFQQPSGILNPAAAGEFVPGQGGAGGGFGGGTFVPGGMAMMGSGNMGLEPGAGEFVPGGGTMMGGDGMMMAGAGEFIPGGGGMGTGEFTQGAAEFTPMGEGYVTGMMTMDGQSYGDEGYAYEEGEGYQDGEYVDGYGQDQAFEGAMMGVQDEMMEGWHEAAAAPVMGMQDDGSANAIVSVSFDPMYEQVWSGTSSGLIVSHLISYSVEDEDVDEDGLPIMQPLEIRKIISVPAFSTPVRQMMTVPEGIVSISDDIVAVHARSGIQLAQVNVAPEYSGLTCMAWAAAKHAASMGLAVAGHCESVAVYDLETSKIRISETAPGGTAVLKSSGRFLQCGGLNGEVVLRDPSSLKVLHTLPAHNGPVTGLDCKGELLVSCGISVFRGEYATDTSLKIFDVRMMPRPLASIPFPIGAQMIKYSPKFSSTLFGASSQSFQLCDVASMVSLPPVYPFSSAETTALDISNSGEMMVTGDMNGIVSVWADSPSAIVNPQSSSLPTDLASSVLPEAEIALNFDSSLSLLLLPPSEDGAPLFSNWPDMPIGKTKAPRKIDPKVLSMVNQKDFVGYVQNSAAIGLKRGTEHRGWQPPAKGRKSPTEFGSVENEEEYEETWGRVPVEYRVQEIKLGKLGIEGFDFKRFNRSGHSGLENTIPNSWVNSWIHTMFHFIPLRTRVINSQTAKEVCLSDELGFLFHMMQIADGETCQATNFLRAFSQLPEASRLELLDKSTATAFVSREGSDKELLRRAQNLNRFVLEQMNKEMTGKDGGSSAIDSIFGSTMLRQTYLLPENSLGQSIETREFQWRLTYPEIKEGDAPLSFVQVLEASLCSEQVTRAWNETSKSYKPTKVVRMMASLPAILSLDSGLETPYANGSALYRTHGQAWLPNSIRMVEKKGGAIAVLEDSEENKDTGVLYQLRAVTSCVFGGSKDDWVTGESEDGRHLVTHVWTEGLKANRPEAKSNGKKESKSEGKEENEDGGQESGGGFDDIGSGWLLINDFAITRVPIDQVVKFSDWRTPALFYFARADIKTICPNVPFVNPITRNVYKSDRSLANPSLANKTPTFVPPSSEELSNPMLVGIDAEFVALTAEETELLLDGTNLVTRPSRMSLGRVSVVRSLDSNATVGVKGAEQRLAGTPLIDDYIKTPEAVMDYLTRFSGLVPGDLDPQTSPHHLIPLKRAYMKLRYLVDKGYTFVGHGLHNDFRIINMYVPKSQIIDTVNIYHLPNRRKISLRFLIFHLLGHNIQADVHDSIEDARSALLLYKKYLELKQEGKFEESLEGVYEAGAKCGWQVPDS